MLVNRLTRVLLDLIAPEGCLACGRSVRARSERDCAFATGAGHAHPSPVLSLDRSPERSSNPSQVRSSRPSPLRSSLCAACAARLAAERGPIVSALGPLSGVGADGVRQRAQALPVAAAYRYGPVIKKLVRRFKFGSGAALAPALAGEMAAVLGLADAQLRVPPPPPDASTRSLLGWDFPATPLLVPIPTHPRRVRARGYDHAQLLAATLARSLGLGLLPLLRRVGPGRAQVGRSRAERLALGADAFALVSPPDRAMRVSASSIRREPAVERPIVLVDDVATTGATLAAAAQALARAGIAPRGALVLAVARRHSSAAGPPS